MSKRKTTSKKPKVVRLNLGAGSTSIPGFTNIDRKTGGEVYPLAYDDNSVDEIRASHVLEHFSHNKEAAAVVLDWVRVLKPGGIMRIAVPDFAWVCEHYGKGEPTNTQGYVMGGHVNADDHHGCIFDRDVLMEVMANAGLERLGQWKSEIEDAAALPVSLNIMGFKPVEPPAPLQGIYAALSAPRYGPVMHMTCAFKAMMQLRIPYQHGRGVFWHEVLSEVVEGLLALDTCQYILTLDYDSVFTAGDIAELYRLLRVFPEYDAMVSVQSMRGGHEHALFGMCDTEGKRKARVFLAEFDRHVTQINTGHFGLTMFRANALRKLPRPWMCPTPNKDGRWTEGSVNADISLWYNWRKAGFKAGLANRVVVGHLEESVVWPTKDLKPVYQSVADYADNGIPADVARR